jgi:hypothetical protein
VFVFWRLGWYEATTTGAPGETINAAVLEQRPFLRADAALGDQPPDRVERDSAERDIDAHVRRDTARRP